MSSFRVSSVSVLLCLICHTYVQTHTHIYEPYIYIYAQCHIYNIYTYIAFSMHTHILFCFNLYHTDPTPALHVFLVHMSGTYCLDSCSNSSFLGDTMFGWTGSMLWPAKQGGWGHSVLTWCLVSRRLLRTMLPEHMSEAITHQRCDYDL